MRRGEVYSLRDRQYASKARPVVIIQDDKIDSFDSVMQILKKLSVSEFHGSRFKSLVIL